MASHHERDVQKVWCWELPVLAWSTRAPVCSVSKSDPSCPGSRNPFMKKFSGLSTNIVNMKRQRAMRDRSNIPVNMRSLSAVKLTPWSESEKQNIE